MTILLTVAASGAAAEKIPGADDPELQAAALAWLAADEPEDELRALGEIAAAGNVAAKILVNRIDRRFGDLDFPELSREERWQFFPIDPSDQRRLFRPYDDGSADLPSTHAQQRMLHSETADEWIENAKILIEAGLWDTLKWEILLTLGNKDSLNVEALEFGETYFSDDPDFELEALAFRAVMQSLLLYHDEVDPAKAVSDRARWGEEPWSSVHYDQFSEALSEGRWRAIQLLTLLAAYGEASGFAIPQIEDEVLVRMVERSLQPSRSDEVIEVSLADLEHLGQTIAADASKTSSFQPLYNSCNRHCPNGVQICLAAGAVNRLDQSYGNRGLEPIILADVFGKSSRAARELVLGYGYLLRDGSPVLAMPQCFERAAKTLVDLIDPPD